MAWIAFALELSNLICRQQLSGYAPGVTRACQLPEQEISSHLGLADVAAARSVCKRWCKGMTQHLQQYQLRVPWDSVVWPWLRGTLYTMCPLLAHVELLLSSRVR